MSLCPFSLLPPRKSRRKQPAKRRRREQPQHPIQVRRIRREQSEQRHACPERRSSKQRQRRHPSFPSQCHHRTAEGRKAGTRPYRLPYSHLIQSAAHRQIGRKRQQHQICTHRRRQAEHDRPHRQSLLLHSIAPHPSRSKERMPRDRILYPNLRKKCAKKRRPMLGGRKTVICEFLGTGMISVMPVPLLSVHPRECSPQGHIRYVPSVCACRWTYPVPPHKPPLQAL